MIEATSKADSKSVPPASRRTSSTTTTQKIRHSVAARLNQPCMGLEENTIPVPLITKTRRTAILDA
eukprot:CAMPEP_0173111110 /NCGR_PEP_ID=MMETSP1102-20130122/44913_1 /TAXON_ID=49646 /ORGANISM="Geminigera sp., Strain Caron Lab Isolate" /LENGTH=65 /DNA_ID=CAMNT_0014011299 /DNA_START=150 /DNA_END=350 /DNA_ORIENTATION=-